MNLDNNEEVVLEETDADVNDDINENGVTDLKALIEQELNN